MTRRQIPYVCSAIALIAVLFFGRCYLNILVDNIRQSDRLALTHRISQQLSSIQTALHNAESPLFTLADILTVGRGKFDEFEKHAKHLLQENPFVGGLFLVPDGVVATAYPLTGNEAAIGHDLLKDPARKAEVLEAINSNQVVLAGPVNMRQGGVGLFARKPVFWDDNGERHFWGLVVALIHWETVLETFDFKSLDAEGYSYALSRKLRTDEKATLIVRSEADIVEDLSLTRALSIPGGEWLLTVSIREDRLSGVALVGYFLVAMLGVVVAGLSFNLLRGRERILNQAEELERMNAEMVRDIARREKAEADLLQAKDAALAATKAKSQFLATMSHEIRTPMNGVHGMLQLLEGTDLDAEQKEFVQIGSSALHSLLALINDILDFSKIEAGKLDIAQTPFALDELCRSIPAIFKEQSLAKKLDLSIEMAADVPRTVVGDPSRIRQVLLNVVGNAVKFTHEGGVSIRIFVTTGDLPPETARLDFEVTDTGIGISAEQLPLLFKPFIQGGDGLVRTSQGTGLGLSIVKRLVHLMGGDVGIESSPGVGTTVRFHVLVNLPSAERTKSDGAARNVGHVVREPGRNLNILLAEDDVTNMAMLTRLLEKLGCDVTPAGNGLEALHILEKEEMDLVLMDIQMPVMDGVEATRRIREDQSLGRKARIPIIAVTAFAMTGDRERFLDAGMDDYIPKPVNMNTLVEAMDRVVHFNRT
jgi:signal transduction histidine kinase/ActR/RegA family two-component response regulator